MAELRFPVEEGVGMGCGPRLRGLLRAAVGSALICPGPLLSSLSTRPRVPQQVTTDDDGASWSCLSFPSRPLTVLPIAGAPEPLSARLSVAPVNPQVVPASSEPWLGLLGSAPSTVCPWK